MPFVASLCAFLGLFFACTLYHQTAVAFDVEARKVLFPPHSYWLFMRSAKADATFTGKERCVEIDYIEDDDKSDIVILDGRNHTKHDDWVAKMYKATVKDPEWNILQYTPLDDELDTGTVEYKVLEVRQNSCYVVERIYQDVPDVSAEDGNEKIHNCELWLRKEKEVGHQRPTYTTQSLKACKKSYDVLCLDMKPVYSKTLCDPV
uniref:Lipocalin/cytosolic fatty-acid binding domain-containing protein n=1 Tax=Amblyomma maculatum TaxID=34609 RepID=G3MNK4_AMBMU